MNLDEFNELIKTSEISLSIPIDKCALTLDFLVERIGKETQLAQILFYSSEAVSLIKSIVESCPDVKPFYQNHNNYIYQLLLNSPRTIYSQAEDND